MQIFITACDVSVFEVIWQKDFYHHTSLCSCLGTLQLMLSTEDSPKVLPARILVSELQG